MSNNLREHAADICGPPVLVAPDMSLREVARQLWSVDAGAAVVSVEGRPLGVVSERDVVALLAQGVDPDVVTAEQAMTRPAVSTRLDDRLLDVAFLMIDHRIRHVPVVDESGEVSGMVSVREVVRPLLRDVLGG